LPPFQTTIQREVRTAGVGLFTGEKVALALLPAKADSGIVFRRVDLAGHPEIPAHLSFVKPANRTTRLERDFTSVHMVEHLLAALSAMGIDNVIVEIEGPEVPAGDGSSNLFVEMVEKAGLVQLDEKRRYLKIESPHYFSEGGVHLIALPADEFRISYTMHYPESKFLGSQYYSVKVDPKNFKKEIAPCRTFSLYEEIMPFIEKGLIKGGGLDNALVIRNDQVLNPGGARFKDEMVRHKILDLIGDLSLIGIPILGHILSVCSGHASNVAFARVIANLECHSC
jgi:UDP-3-O-[3-hydroxymyristoyl] N-acetylglucosamine deacetylase